MPALVQAVTTSYMQDGKQVLELYICDMILDVACWRIRRHLGHTCIFELAFLMCPVDVT